MNDHSIVIVKFFFDEIKREKWIEMDRDELFDAIFDIYYMLKKYYKLTGDKQCKDMYKKLFDLFVSLSCFEESSELLKM